MSELTHFDEQGASRMVDVSTKAETERQARASAFVRMRPETLALIRNRALAKGDVIEVARLAGIMASKRTGDLIPLCHPLGIDAAEVKIEPIEPDRLRIEARIKTIAPPESKSKRLSPSESRRSPFTTCARRSIAA